MALDFGTFDVPVYLQIGDGDRIELGTVTMNIRSGASSTFDKAAIAALLRGTADDFETPAEDGSAAT